MPTSRQDDAEPLDLETIERDLRDRREALRDRLTSMAKPPERGAEISFGKRIGEGTTEAISRLTDVGVGGSLEVTEARTTRALEKLDEGTYGTCDACGKPIAPARLRVAPESAHCIECARSRR